MDLIGPTSSVRGQSDLRILSVFGTFRGTKTNWYQRKTYRGSVEERREREKEVMNGVVFSLEGG